MTKIISKKTITVATVVMSAILIGIVLSPQLLTGETTGVETQDIPVQINLLDSPLLKSQSNDNFPLQFIAPSSLQLLPEASADGLDCDASNVHCVTFDAQGATTLLPTGDSISFLSFNGTYPAPTIRVTEGDIVQVTLTISGGIHSIDQHASQLSAIPNFGPVKSPDSKTYTFVAVNPGVFAYHCEANNVFGLASHALRGMNGMLIVDPKNGYSNLKDQSIVPSAIDSNTETKNIVFSGPAREFSFVYSEWYLQDGFNRNDAHSFDNSKMFSNDPTYTHVNGIPFGYLGPLLAMPPWTSLLDPVLEPDVGFPGKLLSDVIPSEILVDCSFEGAGGDLEAVFCNDADGDGQVENNPPLIALVLLGEESDILGNPSLEDVIGLAPFGTGSITTHLDAEKGDHVRFFIQNNGDRQVPWHIVGEQLDRVTVGANIMAHNIQTWNIAPYSDATIDVVFEQPGVYAMVNHDYSSLFRGQASIIIVHDPEIDVEGGACNELAGEALVLCLVVGGPAKNNPSNAVPPMSAVPDTSLDQTDTICNYGIGSETPNVFTTRCNPF